MPQQTSTCTGGNCTPAAASQSAQAAQLAKINNLKALTGGDGAVPTVAVPLQSSIKGPAGADLNNINNKSQMLFAKQASLGDHDSAATTKTGGSKRRRATRKRRRATHKRRQINKRRRSRRGK